MVDWQNYYGAVLTMTTWGLIGAALITPPPYNLVVFLCIYPVNFGVLLLHPKIAKWIANLRNQQWIYIDVDDDLEPAKRWDNSNFQLWFQGTAASSAIFDAYGRFVEWLSFILLVDPIRHPYYNAGRRIWGIYLKHGDYSFDHTGIRLSEDERKSLSDWSKLFPKKGGYANFTGMWVPHKTSDRSWGYELVPTAEEMRIATEAVEEEKELLNNVPIIRDGIAYPVVKVMRASGSYKIEKELKRSHPIIQEPLKQPNLEKLKELTVVRMPRKKAN